MRALIEANVRRASGTSSIKQRIEGWLLVEPRAPLARGLLREANTATDAGIVEAALREQDDARSCDVSLRREGTTRNALELAGDGS